MKCSLLTLAACLTTAIFAANYTGAVFLPAPKGKHATDIKALELVDHSRIDPYDPNGGPRRLMVSVFFPTIPAEECTHPEAYPYAPEKTAELLGSLWELYGWPNSTGYLERLRLPVCPARPSKTRDYVGNWGKLRGSFPVVLFSHGLGGTRLASASQARAVAANGFVVVTIDHPYDAAVVEYPDGSVVTGRNISTVKELDEDVRVRAKDASFVVDELQNTDSHLGLLHQECGFGEVEKIAMFGHSLGGASSVRAAYDDDRIIGAIDLDGSPYGFNTTRSTPNDTVFHLPNMDSPFLLFNEPTFVGSLGMPTLYDSFIGYKRHLSLEGSFHLTFMDLPLLIDTFGLRDQLPPTIEQLSGDIAGLRARDVVTEYVSAFMGKVLKGEEGDLLDRPSEAYPEVDFVKVD